MLQHDHGSVGAALPQTDARVAEELSVRAWAVVHALEESPAIDVHADEGRLRHFQLTPHAAAWALSIGVLEDVLGDASSERLSQIAMLVAFAQWPCIPEQLALQVAFGRDLAVEHFRHVMRIADDAFERGLDVDDHVQHLVAEGQVPDARVGRCFRGETREAPDRARTVEGIALLRWSAAHAPEELRPPLLCAVAWLYWALGKHAQALRHLVSAEQLDRDRALARSLMLHFGTRAPTWTAARGGQPEAHAREM